MIPYAASIFKADRLLFRMALTLDDVKRVAHLARLAVDEREAQSALDRLTGVFGLIEEMQAVDTRGIEPMSHALDLVQRLREDKVTERDQRAAFQEIAPQVEGGLYLVPKVIE
jgi:aspartyl-tRNA(Asn)/glutamyl-tRNA(Gln) amidotransferase subunit C